ncbi:phage portal protein [Ligilactobacillus sp. WILCCON 0076]|uniref:Phage portal protein n=1 Tax=Ligilactobacillus ubinensis TaxID=2876789 RepID=A0A9X2FJM6_9LACO|nr:phage portal protein [Ligilactobacillus ubinensis]MCP0886942.1 phage portal protein [Ligilactobacillus ubinensis]
MDEIKKVVTIDLLNFKGERSSNVAVDPTLIGDVNDPSYDAINYAINAQKVRIERFNWLEDYYEGNQDIFKRQLTGSLGKANEKVMINHAKYITDMNVGFTTGNPIAIAAGQSKNIKPIQEQLDDMDISAHDTELEKDLSVYGCGYELLYIKQSNGTPTLSIQKIDPRGCVLVTDDTIDKNPLFGIHYVQKLDLLGNPSGYLITVYTQKSIIAYRTKMGYELSDTNIADGYPQVTQHYFGDVPLISYRNNEEKQGDFEQAISLIDAYNELQSDRITDKRNFIDALLVVYGFSLTDEKGNDINVDKDHTMIYAPPKTGDNAAAVEWLTKSFDESQIQVLVKSIKDDIHQMTYVPNMLDENFSGVSSGEAMKYKLFGLYQLLATKERYLTKGIRQRLQLIQNLLTFKGQQCDASGAIISINPNIPVNMTDIINNIKNADGVIPQKVALSWLPGQNDPDEMIKELNQEKQDNIKMQDEILGGTSQTEGQTVDDNGNVIDKQQESGDKS